MKAIIEYKKIDPETVLDPIEFEVVQPEKGILIKNVSQLGNLDVEINNAGFSPYTNTTNVSLPEGRHTLKIRNSSIYEDALIEIRTYY